jgi:hypothetical protein
MKIPSSKSKSGVSPPWETLPPQNPKKNKKTNK